jgi:Tfp pilus assembly protein PilF
MGSELYKQQNKNLALQSVQRGVGLFRDGKNQDAMHSYNKALSIDENNVEAYVARGAL